MSPDIIVENLSDANADYFVLTPGDRAKVDRLRLRVLMEDPVSGAILAGRS
jgi:hypothetical protein